MMASKPGLMNPTSLLGTAASTISGTLSGTTVATLGFMDALMVKGEYQDRDLKLVDAALAWVHAKYTVDDDRIYATGFSNGAMFTYLLWAERPAVFAAYGPVAGRLRVVAFEDESVLARESAVRLRNTNR